MIGTRVKRIGALVVIVLSVLALRPTVGEAQQVFRSQQSANLPTAETLPKGWFLFEISHRFLPAISDGADALWGFDGPVFNRLGLAYAASDRVMLGVLRTNRQDNLELNAKARLWETESGDNAFMVGAMGGIAWNTDAPVAAGADDNEMQSYAQVMLNGRIGEKLAIGLVPTLLYNPVIESASSESALALGAHAQLYLNRTHSLFFEWIVSESQSGAENDTGAFGLEIATRGHFFKIVVSNQVRMNPTQLLAGTPDDFEPGDWRVGFNVTRRLNF